MSFLLVLIVPALLGLLVQGHLKRTFRRNAQVPVANGLSGAEVARRVLDANGLHEVPVLQAPGGPLSDHYDPRKRTVNLSSAVYGERSVAAASVAAHEVGHAIQHARAYVPLKLRGALFPAVAFASSTWMYVFFAGIILGALDLALVAVVLYAVVVLFQLITLPVEFDASKRAGQQLSALGLMSPQERQGERQVLTAAALTYVAGALAAITQLAYFALLLAGNRN